jgi:hypothetical protein
MFGSEPLAFRPSKSGRKQYNQQKCRILLWPEKGIDGNTLNTIKCVSEPKGYDSMQDEQTNYLIEVLENEKRTLAEKIATIEAQISSLRNTTRRPPSPSEWPKVKAGEFAGDKAGAALKRYMKQRRGVDISLKDIVADMRFGGLQPTKDRSVERLLMHSITATRPRPLYVWNEAAQTLRIVDEAIDVPVQARRRRRTA